MEIGKKDKVRECASTVDMSLPQGESEILAKMDKMFEYGVMKGMVVTRMLALARPKDWRLRSKAWSRDMMLGKATSNDLDIYQEKEVEDD